MPVEISNGFHSRLVGSEPLTRKTREIGNVANDERPGWSAALSCVYIFPIRMTDELIQLLRRRESIIADHAWRDRDGAGHLEGLKEVSEAISAWTNAHRTEVNAQMRHYLANASYQKALAQLEAVAADSSEV